MFFLLLLLIAAFGYSAAGNGGIKVKGFNREYFKHDPAKGLLALKSSVSGKITAEWNKENSTPAYVGGGLTRNGFAKSKDKSNDGIRFLTENKELFGLSQPAEELKLETSITDELSMTHCKYQQTIKGLKIYPSELIVHFNSEGGIESVTGNYIPTPIIDLNPAISADIAVSIAKKELLNYNPVSESSELIIFRKNNQLLLAYEVKLPSKNLPKMTYYIDATNGQVIEYDNGIRYDGPALGSGIGLNGNVKLLNTYLQQGKFYLVNASLPMYVPPVDSLQGVIATFDAQNDTVNYGFEKVTMPVFDPNSNNNFNDNNILKAAVDAHSFSKIVYDFYKSHYKRESFDNLGGSMFNVVHYMQNYNNAFWFGNGMCYGDGDGVFFSNLAGALDVIGHEITHGVTQSTANLYYHNESGAINESVSDVFGSLIDSTNWLIGEDVFTPGKSGDALRNMQDPHNGHTPDNQFWQPANMSEYAVLADNDDNGGVHLNSGIPNKAWYNVASVIGHWKSGQIWYRALSKYLTDYSQFSNLRVACLSSAKDLYGEASTEYQTVSSAFDEVGITSSTGSTTSLIYDDGNPGAYVYETDANWRLAVKFTPPTQNTKIQNLFVYIARDANSWTGHLTLEMFESNPTTGLPGSSLIYPYSYTPVSTGWQSFNITEGLTISNDFFVSVLYDGINYAGIGADSPPGNGRAYEYNGTSWSKLGSPDDYTLFMRATVFSQTAIAEIDTKIPKKFEVTQNYPNPFNPSTSIKYSLPRAAQVEIAVFDVNGKRVTELANNEQNPGTYSITWNGKNDAGMSVASGIYYCKIKAGNFEKTNKMILMK